MISLNKTLNQKNKNFPSFREDIFSLNVYTKNIIDNIQNILNVIYDVEVMLNKDINEDTFIELMILKSCHYYIGLYMKNIRGNINDQEIKNLYKTLDKVINKIEKFLLLNKIKVFKFYLDNKISFNDINNYLNFIIYKKQFDKELIIFLDKDLISVNIDKLLKIQNLRVDIIKHLINIFSFNEKPILKWLNLFQNWKKYRVKNNHQEFSFYKKTFKSFKKFIIDIEIKSENLLLFDNKLLNLYDSINNFCEFEHNEEEIVNKIKKIEKFFENQIFSSKYEQTFRIDLTDVFNYIKNTNDYRKMYSYFYELTHNKDKEINFLKTNGDVLDIFQDQKYQNSLWYKPSKINKILQNLLVYEKAIIFMYSKINIFESFLLHHTFFTLNEYFNNDKRIENIYNGLIILFNSLNLLKQNKINNESLVYSFIVCSLNLIESFLNLFINEKDEMSLNSLLNHEKVKNQINNDFLMFLTYYLLDIYIESTNEHLGLNIRNKFMHGCFNLKEVNPFLILFFFICLINEVFIKNGMKMVIPKIEEIKND